MKKNKKTNRSIKLTLLATSCVFMVAVLIQGTAQARVDAAITNAINLPALAISVLLLSAMTLGVSAMFIRARNGVRRVSGD